MSLSFTRNRIVLSLMAIVLWAMAASCGRQVTHATVVKTEAYTPGRPVAQPAAAIAVDNLPSPSRALISEAESWIGTPYLWGGNDRNGVDCSGFVTQVYLKALDIKLPRTSATQHAYCTPLKRNQLQPGDLVFFATGKDSTKVSHVGLYIGGDRMLHSSSSRGVVVSSLNERYYTSHYFGAGRVERYHTMVANAANPPAPAAKPAPAVPAPAPKPAPKPASTPAPKPVPVVAATAAPAARLSGDARTDFLNSLIEQKVDSIFR